MSANRVLRHRSFVLLSCTAIALAIAAPAHAITVNLMGTPGATGVPPGGTGEPRAKSTRPSWRPVEMADRRPAEAATAALSA